MAIKHSSHNLGYYANLFQWYKQWKHDNEVRKEKSSFISLGKIVDPLSELITNALMNPVIASYGSIGSLAVRITGQFSPERAKRLQEKWEDPISTEAMIKICTWIRDKSKIFATSEPTAMPRLEYLHTAGISFCQHLYIISNDSLEVLTFPEKLRISLGVNKKNTISEDKTEVSVEMLPESEGSKIPAPQPPPVQELHDASLTAKIARSFQKWTAFFQEKIFILIQRVIEAVKKIFTSTPLEKPIEKWEQKVQKKKKWIHNQIKEAVYHKANKLIDGAEMKARKKIVVAAGLASTRQTIKFLVSTGLRVGAGGCVYYTGRWAFTQMTGYADFPPEMISVGNACGRIFGAYLWVRCITPTLQNLYDSYNKDFNPEASTAFEVKKIFSNIGAFGQLLINRFKYSPN